MTCSANSEVNSHASIHVAVYFTFFLGLLLACVVLTRGSWNRLHPSSWRYAPLALVPWLTPLLILAIRVLATGGWPVVAKTETGQRVR